MGTYHNPIDRHWPVICELWKSIDRYWPLLTTPRTYHAIGVLISFRYRTSDGAIGVVNHGKNDNDSSYYVHMCEDYAALRRGLIGAICAIRNAIFFARFRFPDRIRPVLHITLRCNADCSYRAAWACCSEQTVIWNKSSRWIGSTTINANLAK